MRNLISIICLTLGMLVCVSVSTACSSEDENDSSTNPLVGTWRAEIEEKGDIQYWDMTFNADYTFSSIEHNKFDDYVHNEKKGIYEIIGTNVVKITSYSYHYGKNSISKSAFVITDGNKLEFIEFDQGIIYYKIN